MVGVRRAIVACLIVGLVVAGAAGWVMFTGAAPDRASADSEVAVVVGPADDGWQRLEYRGLPLEVPGEWTRAETSACGFTGEHWAPADADPCASGPGLWFYAEATFDAAYDPGAHRAEPTDDLPDGGWSGYVTRGDVVVYVNELDAEVVRRVLRSVGP